MASKKEEEKEEEPPPMPEEETLPPPMPEKTNDYGNEYPNEYPKEYPKEYSNEYKNEWTAPSSSLGPSPEPGPLDPDALRQMGFQVSQPAPDTAKVRQHVETTAAAFLSRGLGNLESARMSMASVKTVPQPKAAAPAITGPPAMSTASAAPAAPVAQAPPAVPAPAAQPAVSASALVPVQPASKSQGPRSRSRGRRSASRGRHDDYRGQETRQSGRDNAPPTGGYESRTIQITGGVVGTRLWLKQEMSRFGRVEVCHTGNRQNPEAEPPWVRFEKMSSVEIALQAINAGQVLYDGNPIKAELKSTRAGPPRERQARERSPRRRDLEVTSRDLARDDRRWGGGGGGGSRDLGRDENRGQVGPGNYSSRDLFRSDHRGDRDRRRRRRSSSSRSDPRRRR